VSRPLHIEVSDLAKTQIRAAEEWWRLNRPKAPNAIREELERASSLISVQPKAAATSQFNGRTYYFCTKACKATFDANPSQYVK
jgi:YHS domain-containing protein